MKRLFALCIVAVLAAALPQTASAQKAPGTILIVNNTNRCLWATVYYAGRIVGRPWWVDAKRRDYYKIDVKGVGQRWELRTEILPQSQCIAHQRPAADIRTGMQGSIAYEVLVEHDGGGFKLVRV